MFIFNVNFSCLDIFSVFWYIELRMYKKCVELKFFVLLLMVILYLEIKLF